MVKINGIKVKKSMKVDHSKQRGFLTCPHCGFKFNVSYARAFACAGCDSAALGSCGLVKCPNCGKEFPL